MICGLIATLVFGPQSPTRFGDPVFARTFSYTTRAKNCTAALQELGQASGVKLEADESVRDEVLILRLSNVSLGEAMPRIARACGARWVADGKGWRLVRTPSDSQALAIEDLARRRKMLQWSIDRAKERVRAQRTFTLNEARSVSADLSKFLHDRGRNFSTQDLLPLQARQPLGRFMDSVIARLRPEMFLDISPDSRRAYSSQPNSVERPLGFDISPLLSRFLKELAIWQSSGANFDAWHSSSGSYLIVGEKTFDERIAKVIIVYTRRGFDISDGFALEFLGSHGEMLGMSSFMPSPFPAIGQTGSDYRAGEQPIKLSPEDQAAADFALGKAIGQAPPIVKSWEANPIHFDPLSTYQSGYILQAAEVHDLNLVAEVPDDFGNPFIYNPPESMTPSNVLSIAGAAPSGYLRLERRWFELDGGRIPPNEFDGQTSSRTALQELADKCGDHGTSLNDLQEIVRDSKGLMGNSFANAILSRAVNAKNGLDMPDVELLNAFEDSGRVVTTAPTPYRGGELDRNVNAILSRRLFDDTVYLHNSDPQAADGFSYEPCEFFPDGLPSRAVLTAVQETEWVVYIKDGAPGGLPAGALGFALEAGAHPPQKAVSIPVATDVSRYFLGKRTRVTFRLDLTNGFSLSWPVGAEQQVTNVAVPFSDLPFAIRQNALKVFHRLESDYRQRTIR